MKVLFLVFAILGSTLAADSISPFNPECSKGVTFWCDNLSNAKKCKAVDFCIKAVWTTHDSTFESASTCEDCRKWVPKAREFIKSNGVANLELTCDFLTGPGVSLICKEFVKKYGVEIVSLLESSMDPDTICSKIPFCGKPEEKHGIKSFSIEVHMISISSGFETNNHPEEKPTCPFCLMALQEVTNIIKSNKTRGSIENALNKLCSHLSDKLMSQCTEFVKDYTNEVVDMLLADFTPQDACTFIKLCNDNATEYQNAKIVGVVGEVEGRKVLDNPQCDLCKDIVKVVEEKFIDKNSKQEIREALEKSCSRLKKFADKCKAFVDEYSDRIYDLLEKQLQPEKVCQDLIFCVADDDAESQDYDSGLEIFKLALDEIEEPANEIKEQPQCVICEFVMSKLEDEIHDPKTDEEIKHTVRNICSKMPGTISKTCNQFVDYYFDMIIELLKTMKPAMVCSEMDLCPKNNSFDAEDLALVKQIHNDVFTCAICKGIVTGLDSVVEDPNVDKNIEEFEEKFCRNIAGKYKEKCHNLTQTYGEAIVKLLQTVAESDQVCYKLNLCSMDSITSMVKLTEK